MVYYRVDFQGTIYGQENFQHGHHVNAPGTAVEVATDAAALWLAQLGSSDFAGNYRTDVVWSQVNVSELGATPSDPIVQSAQVAIGDGGTSSTASQPPQCSTVVSIRTATAGSRARGRMYLPPMIVGTLDVDGRLTGTTVTEIANAMEAYFDGMVTATHTPVVLSGVSGAWIQYPVTDIRIGNVIDTQRRRRSDLAETYVTRTV